MVQVIKNAALAGLYLETGNLTNSGKILSSPETTPPWRAVYEVNNGVRGSWLSGPTGFDLAQCV
jgi:hypothetical protein